MAGSNKVPEELLESPTRILAAKTFSGIIERAQDARSVSPGASKNYFQFFELVDKALIDYQSRLGSPNLVKLSWEEPDEILDTEIISISLLSREPGRFDQGAPLEGSVKQLKPVLRESKSDPNNPGYKKAILGKWNDNVVRFTCWAKTNKEAIQRSFWFEDFMNKYNWFFVISGVPRVIFYKQAEDTVINNQGKKLYGRPLIFYVKTEEITEISEKEIDEISINLRVLT